MSSSDVPGDEALSARFAALFSAFSASPPSRASRSEAAFLVDRLAAQRGAKLVCCDRSLVAYGWGLTAEGCAVSVAAAAAESEAFDGALCALDELGDPPNPATLQRLAHALVPGARLVLDAGLGDQALAAMTWATHTDIAGLTRVGEARSPQDRRLFVWARSAL